MKGPMIILLIIFALFILLTALNNADAQNAEARELVRTRCTTCHSLDRIKARIGTLDQESWSSLVERMRGKGAKLSDDERDFVVSFLSAQTSPSAI